MTNQAENHKSKMFFSPRPDVLICTAVFVFAFILRFAVLDATSPFTGDEAMHSVSAVNYTERGYFGPDNWYHPPLKHILLYASIRIFGDNIYGWRMRNVIFGAATVVMLFILSQALFNSITISAISSTLLALDPLHIIFSRTTFEDISAVFFLLAALCFAVSALKERSERNWVFSGIFFGLSVSLRSYCAVFLVIAMLIAAVDAYRREDLSELFKPLAYLSILPLIIYLLVFLPWFLNGYSFPEWIAMQSDAFREMQSLSASNFHPVLNEIAGPVKWFINHIAVGFNLNDEAGFGKYIVVMNNIPVWIFILPAILFMLITAAIERRDSRLLIVSISFLSLYLPHPFAGRPIFLYTSLPLLPLGFIAIGWASERLFRKNACLVLIPAALWCIALYPLVSGIAVPEHFYKLILNHVKILKPL